MTDCPLCQHISGELRAELRRVIERMDFLCVEVKAVEHWATNTLRGGLKRGQCHLVVRNWSGHGRALIALTVFDTWRCLLLLFVNSLDMGTRSSLASLFTIASRQVVNPVAVLQEQYNTITFLLSLRVSPD